MADRSIIFNAKRNPGLGALFIEAAGHLHGINVHTAGIERLMSVKGMCAVVTARFKCLIRGSVGLAVPVTVKKVLEAKLPEGINYEDALKEVVNILCGLHIKATFGNRVAYDMRVPELFMIDESQWKGIAGDIGGGFLLEGEPVMVFSALEWISS